MAKVCRPARPEDLARADELVVHRINELTERHGFGPMVSPRPPSFQIFSLQDDPDGLWVAEDAGKMLGFAFHHLARPEKRTIGQETTSRRRPS